MGYFTNLVYVNPVDSSVGEPTRAKYPSLPCY